MDSIFIRKCQRGKGFGLQMLEDFVLSFKEDCLGLRYPLSPSMYKVCEKYLSQYPGDTGLLCEVEGIGGPNQRTNIASRIQAMEQSAVSKNLSFTEESLVITEMTEKGVVMEAVTTQIKDAESVECRVEIVEEVTVLSATIEAEVPLTARGRSSGSKRRKAGEKIAEDKPEKVLRIEDIEAETPREEQVSAQQETELHNISEVVQTGGMISVDPEEKGEDAVDTVPEETVMMLDQQATVLAPQDLEDADVSLAPMTEELQVEDDLTNTSSGSQITVENVASEIGEAEKEYQKEDTAVLVVSEEVLEVYKGAETLDKVGEKTQIGDTGEKLEKRVTQHKVSLLTHATSEDGEAGRTRRTVVKAIKTVQSETPRRRSKRQHKLQEGLKEESTVQGGEFILRGRTVTKTPTPKRKNIRRSQKVSEELEKEANEVAEVEELIEGEQEEMTSGKKDVADVEELTEEKQQLKDEQLANEGEAKKQQQPGVEDTVVKGSSTELPNTAETAFTKENENEKVTDESEKIQKGEKVETSVIGDKQDVSDDEIQEPPVALKKALRGRLKVTPKPKPKRQSRGHQKRDEEHTDEADLETGGSAGEKKADEQPTDKQIDEQHKEEQEETADKTEKDIPIEESTVLEKSRIPRAEKTAEDVIPSTEVNEEETKEIQAKEETEGEAEIVSLMEAEKEEESISVLRKGRLSAAATARLKSKGACTQCQTEVEGEEETPPAEETGGEEEETGHELPEEKGEEVEEEEKSVEMEKDKDVEDEDVERAARGESDVGDAEQTKDASAEEAAVLTEEDNSVKAVDDVSTDTVQISSAEVEETNSAEEGETTVIEKPTAATEVGSDTAITEEEQEHELTDDSPPRSVRKRPRVDSSEKGEVDEGGETEAATDKEESDDDKDNKKAKSSADASKEKPDNLDTDKEGETTGISQKDDDNEQNMSEEEVEPIVILRGRSVPAVTVPPQPKSRRRSAKAQKAEESLSDEEKDTQLAQAEENTEPEVEMEKIEAVAQESLTEQETVEEEQSAVSGTCAEGQEVASVGERAEETPYADKGMVTDEEEAPPVETRVLRSGEKTVRTTRSKTTKRQDDEQEEAAVEKSTEEDELAVETRILRKGRRFAATTTRRKSKKVSTQCQTEEGEEETLPAEEAGGEKDETWWKLPEEKGEELEEKEKSVEMEKDKESAAGGESGVGDSEQMKDASTEEAAVLEEEDNSDEAVDDISTDTVQISSAEVGETNSAEEEETTVLEKPTVAPEAGSDTASVTGVADGVIQEPDTVAAALEAVIPDIVLGEADAPAAGGHQEKDIGSEIPKLQKATVILVDIKTTCHHLSLKEAEETTVARVHAASEKQQEEENEDQQENIKEKSTEATMETETAKKEKLEEDNSEKEKDEYADVDEKMSEAEEALVTETQTVESSCESTSRNNQQKEEDNTGEGITEKEVDEIETGTDEVEGEMESVEKDAVIVIVPVEKKQSAVSEICREAEIPAGDDADESLTPAEVDKAMSLEEEEEAPVVETRALKRQTKSSKATPKRKSTRNRKQGDKQEEENREEEPAVTTRTLRSGRISASDTQKGKSRRSYKQIQEEEQNVEEKTQSVNKTRVEDEAAKETAVEKTDKEIEKVEEEAATETEKDLEPEIEMEDGKAQDRVDEQLERISKTFEEKKAEASGEECDERIPAIGGEEVELPPDAVTRSLRSGQKMSKASSKNNSVSAEKSTDGNEPPAETRILRRGRKSVCGYHKQLQKEEEGSKESPGEAEVEGEEEEARLGSVKEPPTEVDEGEVPEEDKTEMENKELVPVEVGKGVSDEGTMEMIEDKESTAGDAADADELVQEEADTPLPEPPTDPTVFPPSKEEATHSAEEQQSEEMALQLSNLQRVTVVLVDVQKKHHDVKEGTAAAKGGGSVQRAAANTEEEQKEERVAQEKVTGFLLGTEKNELEKVIVEGGQFQDEVEAVTTKDTGEGRAEETAKEEEAKNINDEQEPIITETRTCRGEKQATPSTKLARSSQKKGELKNDASKIQKEEPTVQIRVLRRGRTLSPVTQKCTTKRTHKQLQEREDNEEVEGEEKSTAVEERVEEEKQQQENDQEKKEKLKEKDATEQEHMEAEMGIDKENTLAEEVVIQQEEVQVNSTETVGNEETEAPAGQHADEGKAPDVAEEAVTTQDTVKGEQSTSVSKEVENAAGENTQETLLTAEDDEAKDVSDREEATVTERGLSSGEKTVRTTRSKTTKRQDNEQNEAAVEKNIEEDDLAVETRILRKGRRSAAATARRKSKRARTQCQTEEEGEEEIPPAEETEGEKEETGQELPEEKGEEVEQEEKSLEMEKDKDVNDEDVERAARGESAVGNTEQMKDTSTEEAVEEEDNIVKAVDDISTDTIQISSAEVEEKNSAEEEETTLLEKPTTATEVGLVGDASVEAEKEAPAITTRALRSKIKTSSPTPSRRSKRQKDQRVVESQQKEKESPEEEQDHELTDDSPPRSVRKRPRVDSSEKGEVDEGGETEAATDKEESDDAKDNKKAKSSADEPKEKLDNLDTDREVETAGIRQRDEDNEQKMSEEEVEPIMIGKRVLRGRSVPAVIITPQPKSRRRSAKSQKAEESLSDEEKCTQLAQREENREPEVEMEKIEAVAQESLTEQETVEEEQSAVSGTCAEGQEVASVAESAEETPNADKGMVTDEEEAPPVETRVLRSGEKTVRTTRSKTTKRQDDEQAEAAVEKSTEEDELAIETRIPREKRRFAAATARRKSKRARTQCQTEEEGEEETLSAEETGGEEEETWQELPEEKGEDLEEEEKSVEVKKDKDVEDEDVERAARGESGVGDAEQIKDTSAEEAAVLTEEDNSVNVVDDISTDTVQISSAEVEETNSAEEEETTVIEKPTAATEVGSDTAITEEEELVGHASLVPEEEAPAITTRALRSKIKTSPATPSRRSKRQKDQGVVETQQQEEESPEEEHDHELADDSPPGSVRKRPRVDSSEKGEVDERGETEANTDKEESDDDKDNKKAKSSADELKEKLGNLDTDREVETTGISQRDEDNEQNMSEEEVEPIVIGKRVLRGRSVPAVIITPQPKSRRRSAKSQKAEESLSDEEKDTQLAQAEENTEPEVEMEKIEAVAQESLTEQETVEDEQSAVSGTCAEGQEVASVGERAEETPNAGKVMVTDEEEAPPVETGVLRSDEKAVRTTRSKTTKRQDDEQAEAAVEKSTEDELSVETLRKRRRFAAATARRKSKRAGTQCQTEEEGEEETLPAEETGGEEEETRQELPEEKGEDLEEEEKSVEMEKDKDVEDEDVERAARGESDVGDAEQTKDASAEEAAVLTEEDNIVKAVDDVSTDTVQISSAEEEETNSAEEEETTVIEKPTAATEVESDSAITEEKELIGDALVVPEEEALAITTRALRSKIKTSSPTPSRRSKRQKDQGVVETQQQEEENPEEEQEHELTDNPRSVRKRPRVDSSEKGEVDERGETEANTDKEESDDDKDNKKAKSSADELKEKLGNLDTDREVETAGISKRDEDNEQKMSEEEVEPIVIGKRVLRGRSVPAVIITPQPKSRRRSAKSQKAEESLSDEEKCTQLAQKRKSTEVTATRKSKRLSRV